MGIFNKMFKSDSEGLIEAYLQTYKKIKNSPQFQVAAEMFKEEFKIPKEFHYANTAIKARRYNQNQTEAVVVLFMEAIDGYAEIMDSINEEQLIGAMLGAAHFVEAGSNTKPYFDALASSYIIQYFGPDELSDEIDIRNIKKLLKRN